MTLALHGGTPVRTTPFPPRLGIGRAERQAVKEVLGTGVLSGFLAEEGDGFLGGPRVRSLEDAWSDAFRVKYAVSMNSATSALYAAVLACNLGPRDEVIVTPWSMSASASCVRTAGSVPTFADIEPDTYGLDPESVARKINQYTKAVVVVDLFGCPARMAEIQAICAEHGLILIEDASQAPGAIYQNGLAGTFGHIGVFSLNYHKTIQAGEGGVAVAHRDDLAERLRLIRNHGETIPDAWNRHHIIGHNFRLGEISAAIAKVQLDRLAELTRPRLQNAKRLSEGLSDLPGLYAAEQPKGRTSVYYLYAVRVDERALRCAATDFMRALQAEGIPVSRYVEPIWKLPAFRMWAYEDDRSLSPAPVCDKAYQEVLVHPLVHSGMKEEDVDDIIAAFRKVYKHRKDL